MNTYRKGPESKRIEDCSIEEDEAGICERDIYVALSRLDDEFSEEELNHQVRGAVIERHLSDLIDKGLVEALWDADQEEVVFRSKTA